VLPDNVTIDRRALLAFDSLTPQEQEAVASKFRALAKAPVEEWGRLGVRQLDHSDWTHFLAVDSSLRVFFSVEAESFIIQDFVRQETLDRYFRPAATPA
jgi:hypothetical protein